MITMKDDLHYNLIVRKSSCLQFIVIQVKLFQFVNLIHLVVTFIAKKQKQKKTKNSKTKKF